MIYLEQEPREEVAEKIDYMMGHEPGIKEIFYSKRKRLVASVITSLIKNDDKEVGFLNALDERILNTYFLDQGILEQYRGKGYGKEAILYLINHVDFPQYFIGETKKDNVSANKSASEIGTLVHECGDRNFYLFDKSRIDEYLISDEYRDLKVKVKA